MAADGLVEVWDQVYHILDAAVGGSLPVGCAVTQDVYNSIPDEVDRARRSFPQVSVFYVHDTVIQEVRPVASANTEREFTTLFVACVARSTAGSVDAAKEAIALADAVKRIIRENRGLHYDGRCAGERASCRGVSLRVRQDVAERAWYAIAAVRVDVLNSRTGV